ncbi:MAG: hypothetical protein V8S34_02475 [Lawsonibacter sp.]
MAGIHLAVQMTVLVLGGTPVLDRIGAIPWLNWSLTWALQAVNLLMLLSLRQGSRTAFALLGGGGGRRNAATGLAGPGAGLCDRHRRGPVVRAGPLRPSPPCGRDHHQRPGLLWPEHRLSFWNSIYCGASQERDVLSGRGYAIAPAPVRLSGRTVLGLVLAVTVAATIPALWLSSRCFVGPAEPLPELSAQQQAAAQNLTALGMDESLVQALSPGGAGPLRRSGVCEAGPALSERGGRPGAPAAGGRHRRGPVRLSGGTARRGRPVVLLVRPEGDARAAHPGGLHRGPQRQLPGDGLRRPAAVGRGRGDPGRPPPGEAGRGQDRRGTVRVGALLRQPGAGALWLQPLFPLVRLLCAPRRPAGPGILAYTAQVPEWEEFTGDFAYAFLHHQIHWLRYPFQSVQALGGTQAVQNKGIARTLWTGVQYYP